MSSPETAIRHAKLTDLPLLHRLADSGLTLDTELACTRGGTALAALAVPLLRQCGIYTLVGRAQRLPVLGQYRLKADDHLAQLLAIAPPTTESDRADTAWLHILDAVTADAGRRGAHILTAEVDEGSPIFCTLRQAGFAVYARQELYRAISAAVLHAVAPLRGTLAEETDADAMDVQLLYANIVPRLVQPISVPSPDSTGIVYRCDGRIQGYLAVSSGRAGIYVVPFFHPDVPGSEAAAALASVIALAGGSSASRLPVTVCVRRYQDWLEEPLAALGLTVAAGQAVMVRHIAAAVRQPQFARVTAQLGVVHALPPMRSLEITPAALEPGDESTA